MTHGGKRDNAGRKPIEVSESRLKSLKAQGLSHRAMAERLGVTRDVIARALRSID